MEAIRKIVTVKDNKVSFELPSYLNNREVELVITPTDNAENSVVREPKSGYGYDKLSGSLKSGLSIEEIDEQIRALRSEWDRDIS